MVKERSRKTGTILLSLVALISIGIFGLRSLQRAGWERSLMGPYVGFQFTVTTTNTPVSILPIPSQGRLEVYELPSEIAPVLVLRSASGAVRWSRLLMPERLGNGQMQQAWLRELRLEKLERDRNGYEILFHCDWEWGGKEGGLIDLDRNYEFKSFRLSW